MAPKTPYIAPVDKVIQTVKTNMTMRGWRYIRPFVVVNGARQSGQTKPERPAETTARPE
jgi:hypothetical protein